MIVFWSGDGIKVIPKSDGLGSVILAPGYNQVLTANWVHARPRVLKQIDAGIIVEEWVKTTPEQAKNFALTIEDGKNTMAPAEFADLNRPRALEVLKKTYHVQTLNTWLDAELRGDIRIAILKQLVEVDRSNPETRKTALAQAMSVAKA